MDPNEAVRLMVDAINRSISEPTQMRRNEAAQQAQEHIDDLQSWLRAGGFMPSIKVVAMPKACPDCGTSEVYCSSSCIRCQRITPERL